MHRYEPDRVAKKAAQEAGLRRMKESEAADDYLLLLLLFIYLLLTIVKIYNKNLHIKNVATPDLVC